VDDYAERLTAHLRAVNAYRRAYNNGVRGKDLRPLWLEAERTREALDKLPDQTQ
jgi:hypothetical protein